jgi:hypothetical protein
MAVIENGTGNAQQGIENSNARTVLYGTTTPVAKTRGTFVNAADGILPVGGINDDTHRPLRLDRMGGTALALNTVVFHEPFEGATLSSPNRLTAASTTFAPAQTAVGGYNFNPTNLTTAAAASLLTTNRRFAKYQRCPLQVKIRARVGTVANSIVEFGFGLPASQTAAPTVGAYWQVTTGGVLQAVLTYNSTDIASTPVVMPGGWQNNFYTWDVILDDDEALFFVQATATGEIIAERRIQLPDPQVRLWDATRLPVFARVHNVGTPASAPAFILSGIDVVMLDAFFNKPWAQTSAALGFGSEVLPTTFAQAANYANSAAPTSATLSNTAAGYATLGGQFQFAAVAGAETDYALFGFTVPVPYSFTCTGVDIDTFNTGAASATTPTLLQWFASPDQTAISLATATNRRVTLGTQSIPVGTAVGGQADRSVVRDFSNGPLVTNPGRIFVIGLKMPVGTATASQIIRGVVAVKGYFE